MLLREEIGRLTGRELHTADNVPFRIDMIEGNEILLTRASGTDGKFHLNHLVLCYHEIAVDHRQIRGVGSEQHNSVRVLVHGCGLCERHPAYMWALLASLPRVQVLPGNTLVHQ